MKYNNKSKIIKNIICIFSRAVNRLHFLIMINCTLFVMKLSRTLFVLFNTCYLSCFLVLRVWHELWQFFMMLNQMTISITPTEWSYLILTVLLHTSNNSQLLQFTTAAGCRSWSLSCCLSLSFWISNCLGWAQKRGNLILGFLITYLHA